MNSTLLALFLAASPLAEADVPKAVLDAVTKRFPGAVSRSFEKEKQGFEAEVQVREGAKVRKHSLELNAAGAILGEEEELAFDELPNAVKDAFRASKFAKAKVDGIERELKGGKTTYELEVTSTDGKRAELVFTAAGTLAQEKARD